MARFYGGLVRATPRTPNLFAAPGIWTVRDALQAKAQNIWPRSRESVTATNTDSPVSASAGTTFNFASVSLGGEADDRIIALFVHVFDNDGSGQVEGSSVTVAGVSATRRAQVLISVDAFIELWTAWVPTGTTGAVSVNVNDSSIRCGVGVFRIVGSPTEVPQSIGTNTSTTTSISTTVDVLANGTVIAGIGGSRTASAFSATWTGVTESFDEAINGGTCHTGGIANLSSAESGRSVSATFNAAPDLGAGLIAASW